VGPRIDAIVKATLVFLNLVALNFLIGPVRARVDLTEEREYTVSAATRRILAELPDRLEIHGFFSEETHAKLAPLVPKIRDLVEEYRIHSGGKVVASFADPRTDEAQEKEAYRRFDVRPTPFEIESRYESGVKSAYFVLVVAFGDRHEKLTVEDMIRVERGRQKEIVVKLHNLEFQLTRAIEKVVREFGSLETRLLEQKEPVRLLLFVSERERLPEGELREYVEKRRKTLTEVADGLKKRFKVGFEVEFQDPAASAALADEVRQAYGVAPLRASALSQATFYLDAIVRAGQRAERVSVRDLPDRERSPAEIRDAVEASIRRLLPGALHRVGVAGPKVDIPPEQLIQYYQRGMEPPGDEFQQIRAALRQAHEVVNVDLSSGKAPLDVDVLLVLKPRDWTEKHEFALDQYLMFGGKAIVCIDMSELNVQGRGGLALQPIEPKVEGLLARYGVTVRRELVLDDRNVPYPLPVVRDLGGLRLQTIEQVPYPWFLSVRGDSIDRQNSVVGSVDALELYWASPLSIDLEKVKDLRVSRLVTSSDKAWTTADLRNIEPKLGSQRAKGYTVPEKTARETLAVALEGKFTSGFKDRIASVTGTAGIEPVLESPKTARLVVIGDTDFASDIGAKISPGFRTNVQFVENLVDRALLDEALAAIRSRGTAERPLREVERATKVAIEVANYAVPISLTILFGLVRWLLRRNAAARGRT
jgi:ABC-2 type transport system permease protein